MSLEVAPDLLAAAERGEIDDAAFAETVRRSLPYAWSTVAAVAADLQTSLDDFADNQVPPPDEQARGQLLRALASDSIRGVLERHFGVRLAFQNCHRVAAFRPDSVGGLAYREFVSPRAQIRNQSPELRNC
ncbi:MAG: SCO5389 family protein [Sporichthyaceae bacterium]|nr:SCO5389 family protein [Sporichthyaceae bacterium]